MGNSDKTSNFGRIDVKKGWDIWERLSSATGMVFGVLLLVGLALEIGAGFPPTGDSASEIAQYFAANQSAFKAYLWTALATIPFQIWFFATLFVGLRRAEKISIWPWIGLVSAVIGNAATFNVNLLWAALTWYGGNISESSLLLVLWTMYHIGGFTLGLFSSTILLGFNLAIFRMSNLWRWIGLFGLIAGVYSGIVFVILCFTGGKPSPFSGLSYMLFIIWVLIVSGQLTFGSPPKIGS
jgi:hypothetical protein